MNHATLAARENIAAIAPAMRAAKMLPYVGKLIKHLPNSLAKAAKVLPYVGKLIKHLPHQSITLLL